MITYVRIFVHIRMKDIRIIKNVKDDKQTDCNYNLKTTEI